MKKGIFLILLIMFALMFFPYVVTAKTLKVIIKGPADVLLSSFNGSFLLINNSTSVTFNGSVKITVFPVEPGFYVTVNGTPVYTTYSLTINKSEVLLIESKPEYVKVSIYINGSGYLKVMLNNGTSFTINKSISFLVLNESLVYLSSPKVFEIDGAKTSFYLLVPSNNVSLHVTFLKSEISGQQPIRISSQGFIGIGLGIIALSFYLFIKKRRE